jgi:hypothetical protein
MDAARLNGWHKSEPGLERFMLEQAKKLLPYGYAIVPIEPTEEMDEAAWEAMPYFTFSQSVPNKEVPLLMKTIYAAMLKAAPK